MLRTLASLLLLSACSTVADEAELGPDAGAVDPGPGPATPTEITVTLEEPADSRLAVAFRDGDGAWQSLAASNNGAYAFVVGSGRWSFAWGCTEDSGSSHVTLLAFSTKERTNVNAERVCPRKPNARLSGRIMNGASYKARVDWGHDGIDGIGTGGDPNNLVYKLDASAGTHDLIAAAQTIPATYETIVATKVAIVRNVRVNDMWSTANVNLAQGAAVTAPLPVTIANAGTTKVAVGTRLYTAAGATLDLDFTARSATGPRTTRGLPASFLGPTEVYLQWADASPCFDCTPTVLEHWTNSIAAQSVTMPAGFGPVSATAGQRGVQLTWPRHSMAAGYELSAAQLGATWQDWRGWIGAGFVGAAPAFEVPDLTQLAGWSGYTYGPTVSSGARLRAVVSSRGVADLPLAYPAPAGTDRSLIGASTGIAAH